MGVRLHDTGHFCENFIKTILNYETNTISNIQGQPGETKGMWIDGFDTLHWGDDMERWPNEESVLNEAKRLLEQLESLTDTLS